MDTWSLKFEFCNMIVDSALKLRSGIRPGPLYPRAGAPSGLRFIGAHNNRL
jgi:hypothetical protein